MKKGPLAEKQVIEYLRTVFPHAERRVMGGANDRGDVAGLPGICIEIKNRAQLALAEWVDEAYHEARIGRTKDFDLPLVWHKRRGKGHPAEWYVTVEGWVALELLREYLK